MDPQRPHEHISHLMRNGLYAEAEEVARTATALHPTSATYHHLLAIALERQKRCAEATDAAREAARLDKPDANRLIFVAALQLKSGDPDAAARTALSVLESYPTHEQSKSVLRASVLKSERFDEMVTILQAALDLLPGDPDLARTVETIQSRLDLSRQIGDLILHSDPKAFSALHTGYAKIIFSQFGEDGPLLGLFADKKNGFYVDVGAHHPFHLSNTATLHMFRGWQGINIDADERSIAEFRIHRPDDINVCCGVGEANGNATMTIFEDGAVNTFCGAYAETQSTAGGKKVKEKRELPIRTLPDILAQYLKDGQQIDLLNVDAEGWDTAILRANDWRRYRPTIILVEEHRLRLTNLQQSETFVLLTHEGYELLSYVMGTSVYRSIRTT